MSAYASATDTFAPRGNWFTRAIEWIDGNGPGAWVALMVAGFVFGGPLGLVILFFILFTGRFGRRFRNGEAHGRHGHAHGRGCCFGARAHFSSSTSNTAFDTYKADTLSRLEREQGEFEAFLRRLRESRDKAEFDQYLADRARAAAAEAPVAGEAPKGEGSGAY